MLREWVGPTVFFFVEREEGVTFVEGAGGHVKTLMLGEHWRLQRVE